MNDITTSKLSLIGKLAIRHHIYASVVPTCEWDGERNSLVFRYSIKEPVFDRLLNNGFAMDIDIMSENGYNTYEDALTAAIEYIRENAVELRCGALTLLNKNKQNL